MQTAPLKAPVNSWTGRACTLCFSQFLLLSDIGGEEEEPFSPFEEDRDVQEEEEGDGEELFGDNFEA